jgi:hypothetical protein
MMIRRETIPTKAGTGDFCVAAGEESPGDPLEKTAGTERLALTDWAFSAYR